jgi:hypothetical protein
MNAASIEDTHRPLRNMSPIALVVADDPPAGVRATVAD